MIRQTLRTLSAMWLCFGCICVPALELFASGPMADGLIADRGGSRGPTLFERNRQEQERRGMRETQVAFHDATSQHQRDDFEAFEAPYYGYIKEKALEEDIKRQAQQETRAEKQLLDEKAR